MKPINEMTKQEMQDTYQLFKDIINDGGELTNEQFELGMQLNKALKG